LQTNVEKRIKDGIIEVKKTGGLPMKKLKQITAIAVVVLLIALYVITLLTAIFDPTETRSWFRASIFATVVVPVLLWAYLLVYRLITKKDDDQDEQK
jgi:protein-S-isoprenylcysteine O-methyltransferase Ste14